MAASFTNPCLRNDLVVSEQTSDNHKFYIIKDPITFRYFRLREVEYYLVRQFDGATDFETIASRVREKFQVNVTNEAVSKFAERVDSLYFFEGRRAEHEISSGRYLSQSKKSLFSRLLFIKLKAFNPDRLLDLMIPWVRFLFHPIAVVGMIGFILVGFYTYSANFDQFRFAPEDLFNVGSMMVIIFSLSAIILMHEFAHALTCKRHGGQVREMGFLLLYFQVCFYCNLSDSWMFKKKSHRLAVIWAGLFFQMVIFAVAVFGWRLTVVGIPLNQFFWLTANVAFITLLFNFNPLIKLDGYYLLSEMVDIPNLREKSFTYFGNRFKAFLGLSEADNLGQLERTGSKSSPDSSKQKRVLIAYTVFATIYSMLLIGYAGFLAYRFLVDNLGGAGFILFLILVALILKSPVAKVVSFSFRRDIMKAFFSKKINWITSSLVLAIAIVVLFLIPVNRQVGGDVQIRPIAEYGISLVSGQGLLELHYRDSRTQAFGTEHIQLSTEDFSVLQLAPMVVEGEKVEIGDTLAAIISNQVSAELTASRAEMERLQSKLALAKSPPKPEEIETALAAVNASQTYVDQMDKDISRNQALADKNLISRQELEQSESLLEIAIAALEESEAKLRLLKSPPKVEAISILQSSISAQEARIYYLTSQQAAQMIISPIAGEVTALYRNNFVLKVATMSEAEIIIPVVDNFLGRVENGAEVAMKARSFPALVFKGAVFQIAGSAMVGQFADQRARFPIHAMIDNSNDLLRDGMGGYAKISCGKTTLFGLISEKVRSFIRVEFWSWW